MKKADYRRIADTYDVARPLFEEILERWMTLISERIGSRQRVEFLDLGCGTGRFSIPIATRLGYSVTGTDYSEGMLEKARNKEGGDIIPPLLASPRQSPLPDKLPPQPGAFSASLPPSI